MNHRPKLHPFRTFAGLALVAGLAVVAIAAPTNPTNAEAARAGIARDFTQRNPTAPPFVVHCPDTFAVVVPCTVDYADGISLAAQYDTRTDVANVGWPARRR